MRLAGKTLAATALLAVFGSVSGSLAARSNSPATPAPRWHGAGRLTEDHGRLKRARSVDPGSRPAPTLLRWRAPYHVDSTEERSNDWRIVESRPVQAARPQAPAQTNSAPSAAAGYETVLLREINQVRAEHSLPAFELSGALNAAADYHSKTMAERGFFTHESADGSPFWQRVERYYPSRGFGYWSVGENLAYGSPSLSPENAVRAWMGSPGHRANLLSATWREIGLAAAQPDSAPGVYGGRKSTIVTADFGVRR